jgi:DNA-binding HxlR family transcriptional regulator
MEDGDVEVTAVGANTARRSARERAAWIASGYEGPCPVRELLRRVGDSWTVLIVLRLGEEPHRFRALLRAVSGVSQRMLTVTLRSLERDGLVARKVFDTKPPAVEYRLTPLGYSLIEPLVALTEWALRNDVQVKRARTRFDSRDSGER